MNRRALYKSILFSLFAFTGCTYNQERRIAETLTPITHAHNMKILRDSLDHPSFQFSCHLLSNGQGAYILKANHLPLNERFLFASMDRTTGKMNLLHEFEVLSDGSLHLFDTKHPGYETGIPILVNEQILIGKQIDYVLVRKKDCTFASARFLPYPLETKGKDGEIISLIATHPMLTRFQLEGKGFSPHEHLRMIHQSGDQVEEIVLTANSEGEIETTVNPTILGKLGGDAKITLIGSHRSISLDYPWGSKLENKTFAHRRTFPILFVANTLPHEIDRDPYASLFF